MIDLTPLVRGRFVRQARRMDSWADTTPSVQAAQLRRLLSMAAKTEIGCRHDFASLAAETSDTELTRHYAATLPVVGFEDIRPLVMRMLRGEKDILWPGKCRDFAQSSGTSGGKSKYIPITPRALSRNHYAGASDAVASYLRLVPRSRLFSGKALILGGSFANELPAGLTPKGTHVGDLSATLIRKVSPFVDLFRIPTRDVALMTDWHAKLPAIIAAARKADVTNLSGVPSWFLILLRQLMLEASVGSLHDIWPNLEVFFHGGISFRPYRSQYESFTDPSRMHFLENYNASEGFFAVQTDFATDAMTLLIDRDVYYEFAPILPDGSQGDPVDISSVEKGKVYALVITTSAGLWRYDIGDTVEIVSTAPVTIRIAGRTKSFINAFGEELMQHNADEAIAVACRATGAAIANYTAAPLYAENGRRGCHQWLIEWTVPPRSFQQFAGALDKALSDVNSDYQAKRAGSIFLDPPQIITAPTGLFDRWLSTSGNRKLGGQRKIPRLSNDRKIIQQLLDGIK